MSDDSPPPDARPLVEPPRERPQPAKAAGNGRRVFLGIVVFHGCLSLLCSAAIVMQDPPQPEFLATVILLGLPFSHVHLAAFWLAFSQRRMRFRLLVSSGLVLLSWFCIFVPLSNWHGPDVLPPGIGMSLQFIVGAILFGIVRRMAGWRLATRATKDAAAPAAPLQFGIRHLLMTMVVVSVVLAIGRLVLPNMKIHGNDLQGFALFFAFNIVLFLPVSVAMLIERGWGWAVLAAAIWTGCLVPVERMTFMALLGSAVASDFGFWWSVNGCLWASIALSLLPVRFAGWRLARLRRTVG